jgi:hypothetical protein
MKENNNKFNCNVYFDEKENAVIYSATVFSCNNFIPSIIVDCVEKCGWEKFKSSYLKINKNTKEVILVKKVSSKNRVNFKQFSQAVNAWRFILKRKANQDLLFI